MTHLQKLMFLVRLRLLGLNTKQDIATFYRNAPYTRTKTQASKFTEMIGLSTAMQDAADSTLPRHSPIYEKMVIRDLFVPTNQDSKIKIHKVK